MKKIDLYITATIEVEDDFEVDKIQYYEELIIQAIKDGSYQVDEIFEP